ncbi:MAG: hypothetical protein JSV35_08000 [Candidatus Bathyarchaeota archaeon]|nr:MAG: hypothetical protein JSV35_08000 [Candidatus Bathyarchaeota archaeon]
MAISCGVIGSFMHLEIVDVIIRVALIVATSFLFSIILLAYLRVRTLKMGLITIGFGVFFVHAVIYIPELIFDEFRIVMTANNHLLIHLVALVFIALGMFKD